MDFLKKHYEKVLLGVVLLGLAVAVAFLPFKIASDKETLEAKRINLIPRSVKSLAGLDLSSPEAALKRMASPAVIDFSPTNRLFNPVPWQRTADGRLIPGNKVGASAATVTNITPLYLRLTLDSVTVSDSGPRYVIGIEKEASPNPRDRNKKQTYCSLNTKNDTFTLREVKGPPDNPTSVILELSDTGERVSVSREQPFKRVDGYMADVNYEPEKKVWLNRRVGATLFFNGEEYNIVDIRQNEVVLLAKSNQKKWIIRINVHSD